VNEQSTEMVRVREGVYLYLSSFINRFLSRSSSLAVTNDEKDDLERGYSVSRAVIGDPRLTIRPLLHVLHELRSCYWEPLGQLRVRQGKARTRLSHDGLDRAVSFWS
jgi:hypothetical protein